MRRAMRRKLNFNGSAEGGRVLNDLRNCEICNVFLMFCQLFRHLSQVRVTRATRIFSAHARYIVSLERHSGKETRPDSFAP